MELFDRIASFIDEWESLASVTRADDPTVTNPATGLPMKGGGIDVAGNPFGTDLSDHHRHDDWHDDIHHSNWYDSISWTGGMGGGHDPWRA